MWRKAGLQPLEPVLSKRTVHSKPSCDKVEGAGLKAQVWWYSILSSQSLPLVKYMENMVG